MNDIDKTLAESRMRFLLVTKNDLSKNVDFDFASVADKEQYEALSNLFNAIDQMIFADARFLTSGECTTEQLP